MRALAVPPTVARTQIEGMAMTPDADLQKKYLLNPLDKLAFGWPVRLPATFCWRRSADVPESLG